MTDQPPGDETKVTLHIGPDRKVSRREAEGPWPPEFSREALDFLANLLPNHLEREGAFRVGQHEPATRPGDGTHARNGQSGEVGRPK